MKPAAISIASLAVALVSAQIAGAEPATLRVADVYPTKHPVPNSTIKLFMEQVEAKVGDQVTFEYYPAQQLGKGKDLLALTQQGIVDVGLVVPSYVSDKLPLSAVAELPGSYDSSCQATMAMFEMAQEGGILQAKEFGPNDVKILIVHAFAPFNAFSTREMTGLADFEGQKLRTLGAVTDMTIESLGSIPIRMSAPEINEAMSRGTIDGGLLGVATVLSYDLVPYVKTAIHNESFGGAVVTYAISMDNWNGLSDEVRTAMIEAGRAASVNGCETADAAVEAQFDTLREAGVTVMELSGEDAATFRAQTQDIGQRWAAQLDERGMAGTEVLEAFRAQLATTN